ncbi:MAG TPA: hypothetical protein VES79_13970 [Solirubrobacteraceae bacterium]|nr:hypothetical protein [Solirubrobacteraceae bacterium]
MPPGERDRPDLDRTREALREHDERIASEADEAPETPPADEGGDVDPETDEDGDVDPATG